MKAAEYGTRTNAAAAFVATNSICQGRQLEGLWPLIFETGHEITFAHASFKWTNLASYNAGVIVVIVGLSANAGKVRRLYGPGDDGETVLKETTNINPYLISGLNVIVQPVSAPLSEVSEMSFGNMPNEGGYLLLSAAEATNAIGRYDVPHKFIRPFVGSQEFIKGQERRCIWVTDQDYADAKENAWLNARFEGVRKKRLSSNRPTTKKLADMPYRFGEVRQTGNESTIIVPSVSSENRPYLPVGLFPAGTIVSNLAFALYDAPLWNMALIASRLHWVWIATVCGRLGTSYRYSNTLGWNTFPVPALTRKNKADLTTCAEDILLAREAHFPKTIAGLYAPDAMPENLRHAHDRNDEILERIYIGRRFRNDTERLEKLFEMYTEMTTADNLSKGVNDAK